MSVPDVLLSCVAGSHLAVVITVDKCVGNLSFRSSLTRSFTYYPPTVTAAPHRTFTQGGVANVPPGVAARSIGGDGRGGRGVVTLLGHGFGGGADMSLTARFGQTAAEAVKWVSDSSLCGLVAGGVDHARDTTMTVSRLYVNSWVDHNNKRFYDVLMATDHRSLTEMLSYDTPQVRSDVLNASRTGGRRFAGTVTTQ